MEQKSSKLEERNTDTDTEKNKAIFYLRKNTFIAEEFYYLDVQTILFTTGRNL